jgi:catechol 2,3-dioxygenase-like lactoylglutathione lyase family enzyme
MDAEISSAAEFAVGTCQLDFKVRTLDHVNIRTDQIAATIRFFSEVLGMHATPSPGSADLSGGAWIRDIDGRSVIHVGSHSTWYPGDDGKPVQVSSWGSAAIHHIAFDCIGYEGMVARLASEGIGYESTEFPQFKLRQLFLRDPNGILVELNFFLRTDVPCAAGATS